MNKYDFTAVLAVRVKKNKLNTILKTLCSDLIKKEYQFFYKYDYQYNWLYVYSNQFEIISGELLNELIYFFKSICNDFMFINLLNKSNFCVMCKYKNKLQKFGINLWEVDSSSYNYIFINHVLIAPFKAPKDNIESLKKICKILQLDLNFVFMGFDKNSYGEKIYSGKCLVNQNKAIYNENNSKILNVKVISEKGIYFLPLESISVLGEIMPELQEVIIYLGEDINKVTNYKFIYDAYFIINSESQFEFYYKKRFFSFSKNKCIIRIRNLLKCDFEVQKASDDVMCIICLKKAKNYSYYNIERFKEIKPNITGINNIYKDFVVYQHNERICPWSGAQSEWNIDSISSLDEPFPVIAVSRKESKKIDNDNEIDFRKIRAEETSHFHPSFLELYVCLSGKLSLETKINQNTCVVNIENREIAIIMPNVPHYIKKASFGYDNEYSHVCIQLLSKFHYRFFTTKRNYEFDKESNYDFSK